MLCSADLWVRNMAGDVLLGVKTGTYWNRVWLASCLSYLADVHMDLTQKGTVSASSLKQRVSCVAHVLRLVLVESSRFRRRCYRFLARGAVRLTCYCCLV